MGDKPLFESIEKVFQAAIAQNRAVAVWRLPEAATIEACVSLQDVLLTGQPQLERSPFGFFLCPFQESEQAHNIFIKADVYASSSTAEHSFAKDVNAELCKLFESVLTAKHKIAANWHFPELVSPKKHQTENGFKSAVEKAITAIEQDEMEKVVLSRNASEQLPASFSALAAFYKISEAYPKAFVSLVSVPEVGTWLGASPEILVSIDQDRIFHTMALAGTQPAVEKVADAIWRQKEIEEQGMVERYVLNCFKKLRLREYTEVGPRTIKAGNLMHLRTDFKVDLKEVNFPTLGTDMLALLHPTSAVCGLPLEPALEFINTYEGYERGYYSGYLGPVNAYTGTHLYVNLRCMEVLREEAVYYAGAGITRDSNPEKEWQETQHKMQTMQRILANFN